MTCARCGHENPVSGKFCLECGTPLTRSCPSCGAAVTTSRFCGECGTPLQATPQPAPALRTQAERRMCSVLFVDLVGFTPFTEARDAEDVREMLSRYFERARTIVERYGGVIEKFIGDAVMAIWGTPVAEEGDAERAVRAGLEVVDAVAELGANVGAAELRARAGVVTGDVAITVGTIGEGIAGDTVNTAARVQSVAAPGTLWVDDVTERLTHAVIGYRDAGEHTLKGKAEPLHLWAATRVLSTVGGVARVDGLEAPLLGREVEWRAIKDLFHASVDRRVTRLIVVSGPAGVGKSRLGWEFRTYADGLADSMFWHGGRCLSYGEGVAFWALAEAVRQRFAISEEDPADVAGRKLVELLPNFVPDPAEQAYVGARLARLLGVPFGADDGATLPREELFAGWRLFFERLAAQSPVVLLIEDAHHADAGLLDFLDHLVDWSRDSAIYVLVIARPELTPGWGTGRNRTTITLDTLDADVMDQLVDALVPGMPAQTRRLVADQAQGIPLYAVETIRSLIDRDIVVPKDGVYRLVGDVSDLTVPDTLRGLLAARYDALPTDLHGLLADAAVLGTSFPAEAVVAVSGRDAADVRRSLDELVRREILDVSADPLSPQRGFYGFSQNLLRQVVYETLSRRDRKARHLAVAAHLRSTFAGDGDEVVEVIAQHYVDALTVAPSDDDSDALRAQAAAALVRAAERALRSGAPARAAESFARAAGLLETDAGSTRAAAALWERAASAATTGGRQDEACEQARAAAALYERVGDERAAARARSGAGRALQVAGRYAEARADLTTALAKQRDPDGLDTVETLCLLARVNSFDGNATGAIEVSAEAMRLAQALGAGHSLMSQVFDSRGLAHHFGNRFEEAVALLEHATRLAERSVDTTAWARSLANVSDMKLTNDPAAALAAADQARETARRLGDPVMFDIGTCNVGSALIWLGRWDEAERVLDDAIGEAVGEIASTLQSRAMIATLRGDRAAIEGLPPLPTADTDDIQDAVYAAMITALRCATDGDERAAVAAAREGLARGEVLGLRHEVIAWCWTVGLRAARAIGDAVAAELLDMFDDTPDGHLAPIVRAERALARAVGVGSSAQCADAVGELREVASPYHLAHALLDQADVLRGPDPDAARACVDEATAINASLRAVTLTRRLAALDLPVPG